MSTNLAIVTWNTYYNFGTYLQAFALQQYLYQEGFDNMILDDSSYIISYKPKLKDKLKKPLLKLVKKEFRVFEKSITQSHSLFDSFKRNMLHIDYFNQSLTTLDSKYDIYICGSDQIWNPFSLEDSKTDFFYASFSQKKKIAYAPSIGVSEVPQQYKEKLRNLTFNFNFLSAREQQGVDILHKLTGKEVVRVVDPTLLLDSKQWNVLLPKNPPCNEKYVLAYFLTPNNIYINAVSEYAHKKGLRLKMFFIHKSYNEYNCDLITAGPIEFLHYVKDAEYLFTDSFHGTIFASIFHTQFFTFRRFKQTPRSQNSRVEGLFDMMGVSERLLDEETYSKIYNLKDINFTHIKTNLDPFINKSKEYIKKALQ
mgnify:CR=1 FL=1